MSHFRERSLLAMLLIALTVGFGCSGQAAAEKAEKELAENAEKARAKSYMDSVFKIIEERIPGSTGKRSEERGLRAIDEIEAISTDGVSQEVIDNVKEWTKWLREGIETKDSGGFSKAKIREWMQRGDSLNSYGGNLRQKYK